MTNSSVKHWFRFSISKLLILVAAFAVILATYSHLSSAYRQSRMSADTISAAGGSVVWSPDSVLRNGSFPFIIDVDLQNCKFTDEHYAALAKIPNHFLLQIDSNIFDQDTMHKLAEVRYLSSLSLDSPVAESAIRQFQQLRSDIRVTVGRFGESSYREYPRPDG